MWLPLGYRTFPSPSKATEPPRRPAKPGVTQGREAGTRPPTTALLASPPPRAALPPARLSAPLRGAVRARRAGPSMPRCRPVLPARGAGARASIRLLQGPGGAEGGPPTGAVSCSCPRHLRWVTAGVTGRGEGKGAAPPARGGKFGKRLTLSAAPSASGRPLRRAGKRPEPLVPSLPASPVVRDSSPLPLAFLPRGEGARLPGVGVPGPSRRAGDRKRPRVGASGRG